MTTTIDTVVLDASAALKQPDVSRLTTASVDGTGVFDILMRSAKQHLLEEYNADRVTGDEYTKLYLGTMTAVMQTAVQAQGATPESIRALRIQCRRLRSLLQFFQSRLRKDDWHRFGLAERQPILGEVPTELVNGEWCFPQTEGPEPSAVITYTDEPSPETGDVGWCWWALGDMGDAAKRSDKVTP